MRQKTIRISEFELGRQPLDSYRVGDEYILVERVRETTGDVTYDIVPHQGHGVPGNLNPDVKLYHGWRGTTDGWSKTACGVRKIIKVSPVKKDREGWDYIKVTVGKDLHPEWR